MESCPAYNRICLVFFLFFFLSFQSVALSGTPSNKEEEDRVQVILRYIDDLWRSSSSSSRMKMMVKTEHYTRTMTMNAWSKGKDKSLIRILSPLKEKGTSSLKSGNTMYTYLPKTDRVIRLTSAMMMGSWMGSHFSNDDLVKESRLSEDYEPLISFEGKREGLEIIELALLPKADAPVVWGKIVTIIRAEDYLPLQSFYYDEDMVLSRTLHFHDIKELDGRLMPAVLRMIPADKPNEYTEMVYQDIHFDLDLSEAFFSLLQLRKR